MPSDKEIVEGIVSNNNEALSYIYKEMFPYVEVYIAHHGGSRDEAKDVFQEAMIVVFKKISSGNFSLHCKFSTYLYAVCKHIWIQDKKKQYLRLNKLQEISAFSEPEAIYGQETLNDAKELFEKHFQTISTDCKKILQLYFNGVRLEEIRKEMGITTLHHTTDKKYRCKQKLIEKIKNDPLFIKLKK